MKELSNYIKSDLYKLWHSSFFIMHVVFMCIALAIIAVSNLIIKHDGIGIVISFYQILGISFPFAISIVTHIMVDQEVKTSKSQNILILSNRYNAILSKFIIVCVTGFITVEVANIIIRIFTKSHQLGGAFNLLPFILIFTNIVVYVFFIFIAFRFGKTVSISMGVVGSLLAVLLRTGLGAGVWHMIPFGWGSNMVDIQISKSLGNKMNILNINMSYGQLIELMIIVTCAAIGALVVWFSRYDGRCASE